MTVVEREALLPVGGIGRRVEVHGDALRAAEAPLQAVEPPEEKCAARLDQAPGPDGVLEAAEGSWRGEVLTGVEAAVQGHLQPGVTSERKCVVAVLVAERQAKDALPEQRLLIVLDSRGIPLVDEVLGEKGRQPDALVQRTQQGRAAIRRQRLSLELDLHRLEELVWEQDPGRRARRHERLSTIVC